MKKIIFTALALLATLGISAQTIKVYEYDSEGNLSSTPAYTSNNKVKIVFEKGPNNPNAGKVIEGTTTINGTTYTKAIGGTEADYVDLGMVVNGKKILWATHNLGATTETDYGAYIAWGDKGVSGEGYVDGLKLKDGSIYYEWSNLKYCNGSCGPFTKYVATSDYGTVDNKTTLESEDDAATVNWGSDWRTPTYDEWVALNNTDNFIWTWDAKNKGYTVTSKISGYEGKSIFLPAAGYRYSSHFASGPYCSYWSSSLSSGSSVGACYCHFYSGFHSANYVDYRCNGRSVRPVRVQN